MNLAETYPKLNLSDADQLLRIYATGDFNKISKFVESKTLGNFVDESQYQNVEETLIRLHEVAEETGLNRQKNAQEFQMQASIELHESFSKLGTATRDPNFWRWVIFSGDCYGASLVDLRYGGDLPGSAQSHYYGIGRINQGFISSLWLRAEITYDNKHQDDPYHLTKAILDIDFWWSHAIRLSYPGCRNFAKAFVKFVAENNVPRGNTSEIGNDGFRDLAPELKRRFATTAFEVMDQDTAYKFIENVWLERETWKILG